MLSACWEGHWPCSGDDGRDGIDGEDATVTANPVDTCIVCHGDGSVFAAADNHDSYVSRAASWEVVDVEATDEVEETVVITVNIDDPNQFTNVANVRAMYMLEDVLTSTDITFDPDAPLPVTVVAPGEEGNDSSNHIITIKVADLQVNVADRGQDPVFEDFRTDHNTEWTAAQYVTWRVRLNDGENDFPEATVVAYQNAPVRASVSDQACINCHGDQIFVDASGGYMSAAVDDDGERRSMGRTYHFSAYGVESCVMCHGPAEGAHSTRLRDYAHGVHNSNNVNQVNNETGSMAVKGGWNYSVRYPGDMTNCYSCHDTPDSMDHVMAEEFTRALCASCHGVTTERTAGADVEIDWDSFNWDSELGVEPFHKAMSATADCVLCHDGVTARGTIGDYHAGHSDRGEAQLIADQYFQVAIESVAVNGTEYAMTWSAVNPQTDAAYDVCGTNSVDGLGNVTFSPLVRRAYFEPGGDDMTNKGLGENGQPSGTTGETACSGGTATTTFSLDEGIDPNVDRMLAILKPQATVEGETLMGGGRVRIAAVTYAFNLDDGSHAPRRVVVDNAKCLACHQSQLYNHSPTGGRYDNIDSCIACHNPSATDQGVRAGLGVDGSTAYDGKDAETFGFAYNMHAIHSAGVTDAFYLVYRGRGLYGYGGQGTLPNNWPTDADGNALAYAPGHQVHGSDAEITHYLKKVTYPNVLSNCMACHVEDGFDIADQNKVLAYSIHSGDDLVNQNDDRLISPATATCMSCHQSGVPSENAGKRAHAYQNSWWPSVLKEGKQTVLDAAQ